MMTEQQFFEVEQQAGISLNNPAFINLANETILQLKGLNVSTILDYGAGVGAYTLAALNAGYNVSSYDYYKVHVEHMQANIPNINIVNQPFPTDLMMFIEVAEHMTDKELNALFKKVKGTKYILFSSTSQTTPNDIEWGHINVKHQEEWVKLFEKHNYTLVKHLPFPTEWSKLFKYNG